MNNDEIINEFLRYCKMDEHTIKIELFEELKKYYKKLKFGDGFILAKGDIPVMLVAHIDTVHRTQCTDRDIFINNTRNIIKSDNGIGGDDRCGVFMIMDIIKKTKHRPYIVFTEDEECGGLGAKKFVKRYNKNNTDINFMIELDRMNANDSVYYDLDNKDFEDYINKFGFKTAHGSYTDICELCPAFNCAGVNLSCGYYKQHTTNEYVNITEMLATIYKVVRILEDFKPEDKFMWIEKKYNYVPVKYKSYSSGTYYRDYDDWYSHNYEDTYSYGGVYDYCDYCGCQHNIKDLHMTEDGNTYICDSCMKKFGLTQCVDCGVAMFYGSTGNLCQDCKKWHDKQYEQERLDI